MGDSTPPLNTVPAVATTPHYCAQTKAARRRQMLAAASDNTPPLNTVPAVGTAPHLHHKLLFVHIYIKQVPFRNIWFDTFSLTLAPMCFNIYCSALLEDLSLRAVTTCSRSSVYKDTAPPQSATPDRPLLPCLTVQTRSVPGRAAVPVLWTWF